MSTSIINMLGNSSGYYPSIFVTGLSSTDSVSAVCSYKTYTPEWVLKNNTYGWFFKKIPDLGSCIVTATDGTFSNSMTILIEGGIEYDVKMTVYPIVSWSEGTNAEIVRMMQGHYDGDIDVTKIWSVGDSRSVTLSAMEATNVGETQPEQTVTLVLMHQGGIELTSGGYCTFVVGQKEAMANKGYMCVIYDYYPWVNMKRRAWCNNEYYNSFPDDLRPIFKQSKTKYITSYNGSTVDTVDDYFAIPAEREVLSSRYGGQTAEWNSLLQFDYYKSSSNWVKLMFTRSLTSYGSQYAIGVNEYGTNGAYFALGSSYNIIPYGCI